MFYTNGIMLRKLTNGRGNAKSMDAPSLAEFTHLVVDEVHERDKFADFLLIRLRDLLQEHSNLRLILMSATLNQQMYSDYFGGCPVIEVPGFTHQVQSFFLEDVLACVGYQAPGGAKIIPSRNTQTNTMPMNPLVDQFGDARDPKVVQQLDNLLQEAFMSGSMPETPAASGATSTTQLLIDLLRHYGNSYVDYQHSLTGATALMVMAGQGRLREVKQLLAIGADPTLLSNDGARVRFHLEICAQHYLFHD